MTIELHIEELILHGFSPADQDDIGAAVQRELARLLTERGLPAIGPNHPLTPAHDGTYVPELPTRQFTVSPTVAPADRSGAVGSGIAETVYRQVAGRGGDERQSRA